MNEIRTFLVILYFRNVRTSVLRPQEYRPLTLERRCSVDLENRNNVTRISNKHYEINFISIGESNAFAERTIVALLQQIFEAGTDRARQEMTMFRGLGAK